MNFRSNIQVFQAFRIKKEIKSEEIISVVSSLD